MLARDTPSHPDPVGVLPPTSPSRRQARPRGDFGSSGRGNDRGSRGQRRGRGRGHRGGAQNSEQLAHGIVQSAGHLDTTLQSGQHLPNGIAQPTLQVDNGEIQPDSTFPELSKVISNATTATEAEVCFICASAVVHNSIAPCNHRTCNICALRMRALYKNKTCAHCRTQSDYVIFTDDPIKRYEDFTDSDFSKSDDNLGIKYGNNEILSDTELLLRYNCPDENCDVACRGWPDLHRHVRSEHHKVMCDLCTRNKKVFTHEHTLFTKKELERHEKSGDDNPGAVDQSGFKGHPQCGFCRQRFYGDDELYTHCRDKHERCHICDRRNSGRQPQYYVDYNSLESHFQQSHFLCLDQECLDKKFIVFESELDLKAHQLQTHPNGMTKDVRRDARMVDMSSFDYRQPYQQNRGRGRESREGRGRGRDPNSEPLPLSSAQPMGRAELAYQRQLAIQSAQSISNRTFGGQLTSSDSRSATPPASQVEPNIRQTATSNPIPSLNNLALGQNAEAPRVTNHAATPEDQARQLRHNAVNERAANLLKNDQSKLVEFRAKVSSYRNSSISATNLIQAFFVVFDTSSTELGKLVKELAEIFEIGSKKDDLLRAWNDWRAINEDYPDLPGPSGATTRAITSGGMRILRLKSSTAQSSRSAVSRQGSWGSASSNSAFPPMQASGAASSANRAGPGKVGPVPWATSTTSKTTAPAARTVPRTTATPNGPGPAGNADSFPALPAAQKPGMNVLRPGYKGNPTKRDSGSSTPVNAWGMRAVAYDSNLANAVAQTLEDEASGGGNGAGKKKGKKKQTLLHFG